MKKRFASFRLVFELQESLDQYSVICDNEAYRRKTNRTVQSPARWGSISVGEHNGNRRKSNAPCHHRTPRLPPSPPLWVLLRLPQRWLLERHHLTQQVLHPPSQHLIAGLSRSCLQELLREGLPIWARGLRWRRW
jgi:hypothetical protein